MGLFSCADGQFTNHAPDGSNNQDIATIRITTLKDGTIHLIGVGDGVSKILTTLPAMIAEYKEEVGEDLKYEVRSDSMVIEPINYLKKYRVLSLVISNRCEWSAKDPADRQLEAENALRRGLERQAEFLGMEELPTNFRLGDFKEDRVTAIRAGSCDRAAISGTFRMNVKLRGPWMVGPMVSKGCGHLIGIRKPIKDMEASK